MIKLQDNNLIKLVYGHVVLLHNLQQSSALVLLKISLISSHFQGFLPWTNLKKQTETKISDPHHLYTHPIMYP